jgi:hypothetical protein
MHHRFFPPIMVTMMLLMMDNSCMSTKVDH